MNHEKKRNNDDEEFQSTSTAPSRHFPRLAPPPYYSELRRNVPLKRYRIDPNETDYKFNEPIHQKQKVRNMSVVRKSVSDAADFNGIQTISHTSGAKFAIPLTMQAHPVRLTDIVPDEKSDILTQDTPLPYCISCHSIFKTWQGYEYHVIKEHVKYRPYKCIHCSKETFVTEEEARFHMSTLHPELPIKIVRDMICEKEFELLDRFKVLLMMVRDGPRLTVEKIEKMRQDQMSVMAKFARLRFNKPYIVVRKAQQAMPKLIQTPSPTAINSSVRSDDLQYARLQYQMNIPSSSRNVVQQMPSYMRNYSNGRVMYRNPREPQ